MSITGTQITLGTYYTAALTNTVGVLIFTKGLTNQALMSADPVLFSRFGLVMIMVWGLCYFACAQSARSEVKISLVFAIEKLAYVISWIVLLQSDFEWGALFEQDLLAGIFYSIYGVVDGVYLLLFLYCARLASLNQGASSDHA